MNWTATLLGFGLLGVGCAFLVSQPDTIYYEQLSATSGFAPVSENYPVAIATTEATSVSPVLTSTETSYMSESTLAAQLAALLPNLQWLLNEHTTSKNNESTYFTPEHIARLERQIFSTMDNDSDSRRDLSDSLTDSGTFTNPTVTGGTLTDALLVNPQFDGDISVDGALLVGTTTERELVTIDTGAIFIGNYTPATTTNRLYSTAGDLYWAGNLLAGGSVGNWDSNGTDVYRATGNVGIGTTTPDTKLTVEGNTTLQTGSNGSGNGVFTMIENRTGTNRWIIGAGGGVVGANNFYIGDLGDYRMTYLSNGNVGIGTTSPIAKLQVSGDILIPTASKYLYTINGTLADTNWSTGYEIAPVGALIASTAALVQTIFDGGAYGYILKNSSDTSLFEVQGNDGRVYFAGNVGIGTSTPGSKLTIDGNVQITGALRDSNNSAGTSGFVLQSTGTGMAWVATSSLGIVGGSGYGGGDLTVDGFVNISDTSEGYDIGGATVLYASSTNQSVGVGIGAGANLRGSALLNTALGFEALNSATSSSYNTAVGAGALRDNTSGIENVALGYFALNQNTTGSFNTIAGYNGLYSGQAGVFNTAFGHNSLYSNVTGAFNTVLGASAGYDVSTSNSVGANTLIGYNTGRGITTGVNNTVLGANVTGLAAGLSNNIIIADGAGNRRINVDSNGDVGVGTSTAPTARLMVTSSGTTTGFLMQLKDAENTPRLTMYDSGNVGIGTTTPGALLTVAGTINSTDLLGGVSTLSTDVNGNIIPTPSDARLKTNVTDIDGALDTILALRGVKYEWLDKERFGELAEIGFLAQEVDPLIPEVVRKGGQYWTLNTPNILAVVVEAIKEMWETVQGHDDRIETLESENAELRARLEQVEAELDVVPVTLPVNENESNEDGLDEEPVVEETTPDEGSEGEVVTEPETAPESETEESSVSEESPVL